MNFKFLTIILLFAPAFNSLEFVENQCQSGLIFQKISNARITYDNFILVYHADLQSYFDIKDKILECYNELRRYCDIQIKHCDIIYTTIDRRLSILDTFEGDIKLYQIKSPNREKRWIKPEGTSVSSISIGFLDAIKARQYRRAINRIQAIDYSKLSMVQNDNLFIKENIIIQKSVTLDLYEATRTLIAQLHRYSWQNIVDQTDAYRYFLIEKMQRLINHWFVEHEFASNIILDHLQAAMYSEFSQLISTSEIKMDLMEIEQLLSGQQKLPINIDDENALNIFKFAITKSIIYESKLFIEITIPKTDREQYTLYKIIPIPTHSNGFINIIIPSMEYVLIDGSTANFIPATRQEFENAPINSKMKKIVSPHAKYLSRLSEQL